MGVPNTYREVRHANGRVESGWQEVGEGVVTSMDMLDQADSVMFSMNGRQLGAQGPQIRVALSLCMSYEDLRVLVENATEILDRRAKDGGE